MSAMTRLKHSFRNTAMIVIGRSLATKEILHARTVKERTLSIAFEKLTLW